MKLPTDRNDTSYEKAAAPSEYPVSSDAQPQLMAYRLYLGSQQPLVPAPIAREWMTETRERFANRCLPLLIANQAGWLILNTHAVHVTWNGGSSIESIQIEYPDGAPICGAVSHFGHGILTWHLPYLFRTSRGFNLLVRGPANWPKDGVYALEGVVETDWSFASFTMNWQLLRPNVTVTFGVGEPICMLVPQRRGELESFRPALRALETEPNVAKGYRCWSENRTQFLADLHVPDSAAVAQGWQKDYVQGKLPNGTVAPHHQRKLALRPFEEGSSVVELP